MVNTEKAVGTKITKRCAPEKKKDLLNECIFYISYFYVS